MNRKRLYLLLGLLVLAAVCASTAHHLPVLLDPRLAIVETNRLDEVILRRATAGDARSQHLLGLCYERGALGKQKDETAALEWFRKAAENGFAPSQLELATRLYRSAQVAKADWLDVIEHQPWEQDADSRQNAARLEAQAAQIRADAEKWLRKAAEQGLVKAQFELAERLGTDAMIAAYTPGELSRRDDSVADRIRHGLINIYNAFGLYRPPDAALEFESLEWCRKAAEHGHLTAQQNLGVYYSVHKIHAEAAKWYKMAADQGDRGSALELAQRYRDGNGVPKDEAVADKLALQAVEGANPQFSDWFLLRVGDYYRFSGDPVEAYKWFNIVAVKGKDSAGEFRRDFVARQMTPAQVDEGQRRSAAFLAAAGGSAQADKEIKPWDQLVGVAGTGSGFFVTEDGCMCTSYHGVANASRIVVRTKAGGFPAKLLTGDAANDLAILKVEGKFRAVPVAASRGVQLGEPVFTIGFPNVLIQGFEPKLTRGEVSSLAGIQDDPRYFQISVPVQPGNSGSPLFDSRGNVVGVVAMQMDDTKTLKITGSLPQNVNYAVKGSSLFSLLQSIPGLPPKLKQPYTTKERKFEDVVREAQEGTALILVY
jgi:S1-C subfamily serine protease